LLPKQVYWYNVDNVIKDMNQYIFKSIMAKE